MTRIHVQRWDWSPFHELIAAWTRFRPIVDREKVHMHFCTECGNDERCYKPDCTIILVGGKYAMPWSTPYKCRKCQRC